MASGPITSWEIDGETVETVWDFVFLGSKITADNDCSHEMKDAYSLEGKLWQPRQHITKQRHYFVNKGPSGQGYGFSSGHVRVGLWGKLRAEKLMLLNCGVRRLLRVPRTPRRYNQSILKEISPGYSLDGLMFKLKLQYFGHLMRRADSFEKTLMLGKMEGRRRRGWQRMRWEMVGWHHRLGGHEFESTPGVGDRQGGLACCGSWDCKESDRLSKWTELNHAYENGSTHLSTQ